MKIKKQTLNTIEFREAPNRIIGEMFSAQTLGALEVTVRLVDLAPTSEQSSRRPHCHEEFEEVIHILQGRGRTWADGEWHDVEAGDTILIPPRVMHVTFNVAVEPLRLLRFFPRSEIEPFTFGNQYLTLES